MDPLASVRIVSASVSANGGIAEAASDYGSYPDIAVYVLIGLVLVLSASIMYLERRLRSGARRAGSGGRTRRPRAKRAGLVSEPTSDPAMYKGSKLERTAVPDMETEAPIYTTIRVGKLHGQGARDQQQDSFGVSDAAMAGTHGQLAVVCDGMGGLKNGGEVSIAAVETILDKFLLLPQGAEPIQALESLAFEANKSVNKMLGPEGIRACGSTLVMALVNDNTLSFLSIGDSRICLYRDGELMQLTREHVYESELVLRAINGEMSLYDAVTDEQGKSLVSYLGMGKIVAIDVPASPLRIRRGDVIVLMTDGVFNALDDSEISQALAFYEPEDVVERLKSAIEKKAYENQDNYTAVVMAI